ncbi:helix-turn-helix domain-containing protein [Sulfitobacter sp. BDSS02]|nr:helix-turn-helix domain-containing protein [Sulfitobacter sp. BDSS02]
MQVCYVSEMHKSVRHKTILAGVEAISISSDRTFPRHSHDEFGFGYIVDGAQDSWSGRGLVEAEAGDTITVNPGELHDGVGRKGYPRHWRMMFLSPTAIQGYCDKPVRSAEFSRPVLRSRQALKQSAEAFTALTQDQPDANHAEQLLMLALHTQLDSNPLTGRDTRRTPEVRTVLDMIFQGWDSSLSLADFAVATNSSRYQILRRFSYEVGTTPHAYLTQHRIKRAKEMIVAGSPLAETALACGFSDQSHLTRAFSRQLGLTPGCFVRKVG